MVVCRMKAFVSRCTDRTAADDVLCPTGPGVTYRIAGVLRCAKISRWGLERTLETDDCDGQIPM